jgi:hypothetical protein
MISKRFLVPVLALIGLGLPASADVVAYCSGGGCGGGSLATFNTAVTNDGYTYASVDDITFGSGPGVLSGNQYTDDLTSVLFQAVHNLTDPGALDTQSGTGDALTITIPATYTVVLLDLTSLNGSGGYCIDNACDIANLNSTPTTIGYMNSGAVSPWTIEISSLGGSVSVAVNDFNVAGAGAPDNNSPTPEVGTLLLIGSGLIAMRWMRRWPLHFFRTPQIA